MRRNEDEAFFYRLLAYLGASLLLTALLLLLALAAMKAVFALALAALGPREVYWLKPALYDSVGFALASAGTALGHYLMASRLRPEPGAKAFTVFMVCFTALFSGLFFWRLALPSALGAYGLSGLCVTLAALLGGLEAVLDSRQPAARRGQAGGR